MPQAGLCHRNLPYGAPLLAHAPCMMKVWFWMACFYVSRALQALQSHSCGYSIQGNFARP